MITLRMRHTKYYELRNTTYLIYLLVVRMEKSIRLIQRYKHTNTADLFKTDGITGASTFPLFLFKLIGLIVRIDKISHQYAKKDRKSKQKDESMTEKATDEGTNMSDKELCREAQETGIPDFQKVFVMNLLVLMVLRVLRVLRVLILLKYNQVVEEDWIMLEEKWTSLKIKCIGRSLV